MRGMMLVILAACGGGDGSPDGSSGDSGGIAADVTIDGTPGKFAAACQVTESETFFDIAASKDAIGLEIEWKKAIIMAPGTYPTGGIVADIFLYAHKGDARLDATGSVTFTTYAAPRTFAGSFVLSATGLAASGTFDCR